MNFLYFEHEMVNKVRSTERGMQPSAAYQLIFHDLNLHAGHMICCFHQNCPRKLVGTPLWSKDSKFTWIYLIVVNKRSINNFLRSKISEDSNKVAISTYCKIHQLIPRLQISLSSDFPVYLDYIMITRLSYLYLAVFHILNVIPKNILQLLTLPYVL